MFNAMTRTVCVLQECDRLVFAQVAKSGKIVTKNSEAAVEMNMHKVLRQSGFSGRSAMGLIGLDQCNVAQRGIGERTLCEQNQVARNITESGDMREDDLVCRDAITLGNRADAEEVVVIETNEHAVSAATAAIRSASLDPICLDAYELAIVRGVHACTTASSPENSQLLCVVYPELVTAVLFNADCEIQMIRTAEHSRDDHRSDTHSMIDRVAHEIDMIALYSCLHASDGKGISRIHLVAPDEIFGSVREEVISRVMLPCYGLQDLTAEHPWLSVLIEQCGLSPSSAIAMLGMLCAEYPVSNEQGVLRCA